MADPSEASTAGERRLPPPEPPPTVDAQTVLVQRLPSHPVGTPALRAALAEGAGAFSDAPMANAEAGAEDDMVGTDDIAALLGLSVPTVHKVLDRGGIASEETAGGHRRASRAAVFAWKAQRDQQRRTLAELAREADRTEGAFAFSDAPMAIPNATTRAAMAEAGRVMRAPDAKTLFEQPDADDDRPAESDAGHRPLPSAVGAELEDFCFACDAQVTARLALRTVRLEESGVDVDGVLVAVCGRCDAVTCLLPESAIPLRDARARAAAPVAIPNATTLAAMADAEAGRVTRAQAAPALLAQLDADDDRPR